MPSPLQPRRGHTTLTTDDSADYTRDVAEAKRQHDEADAPSEAERKAKLVEQALERFRLILQVEGDQRKREVEDLEFDRALVEDQWPKDVLQARAASIAPDGSVIHARPCLVINKLDQPVRQIVGEARKARLALLVKPKGNGANTAGAELRQGMLRSIEAESRANIARIWALERAVKCGRGAYRILKTYSNDGDFDLDLVVARIKNQGCVYLDPYAQEPDWSDGEYAFITQDMPLPEYKRLYGKSDLAGKSAEELQSITDKAPGWVTVDEKGEGSIRIAEYFYVEYEKRTLCLDPRTNKKILLDAGAPLPPGCTVSRPVQIRKVKWAVINAIEPLDEEDWEGRYIPIIPVIGKEYQVDGEACYKGVISNAKDAQRLYNYARSSQALRSGLESLAPWVMAAGQDEGYEEMWDQANTRAFTRLKYKPVTFEGNLLPPPQRNDLSSTNLSASMLMAREADGDVQAMTGRFAPSLGKQDASRSGKAINALKQQGESSSSDYLENLATISMVHEGRVLLDLLKYVYDRPGRIVRLLGDDPKDEREVLLHQSFIDGPDGRPLPTAPNTPGLIPTLLRKLKGGAAPEPKKYDLSEGDYSVTVAVGSSFANQKDANAALLAGLMQSAPGLTPILVDIYAEQLDGPIAQRIVKRVQRMNPQLVEPPEGEAGPPPIPPEVQQKLAEMEQQLQMQGQALQQAQQELATANAKVQAQLQMKQMELASRERIAAAQVQADLTKTKAEVESKEAIAGLHDETKRLGQVADQAHETGLRHMDAEIERQKTQEQAALGIGPAFKPSPATFQAPPKATFQPPDDSNW